VTIADRASFSAAFSAALVEYLHVPNEAALSHAYELGRRAINEGVGLLELVLMFQDAIAVLTEPSHVLRFNQAAEFLFEALAPFEMTFRGYKDANEQLQALMARLEQQNRELTAATTAAKTANKELEAFSYSVSHDLRAPVRHIAGFSRLLLEQHREHLPPDALRHVAVIEQAAQNMAHMIDDLLNLSRIERQALVARDVDLNAVVAEVLQELQHDLVDRTIEWRLDPLPTAMCDRGLMKLVFTNLLSNAAKYSRHRPRAAVHVGQTVHDGEVVVFVKDNGAGFDANYAHKLFGVFQRLHRSDEFEGTGVGLATVERIVRKHGGMIWAEGALDEGATFFFTLRRPASDTR
jgi:light-regulated signal transduction histidine kinase (bacteriophytochrome)